MKNEWVNYGDLNPIEHGGIFIRKDDDDFPRCYYVVEIVNMNSAVGEPGFLVVEGYVDLNDDDWIEWDRVLDFIGEGEDANDITKVLGAFAYYGCREFEGEESLFPTEEETIEELDKHGITIED